jgi:hypothetical protein
MVEQPPQEAFYHELSLPPCLLFVSFWSTYVFRRSSTFDFIGTTKIKKLR